MIAATLIGLIAELALSEGMEMPPRANSPHLAATSTNVQPVKIKVIASSQSFELARAANRLFYLDAVVNGVYVKFIVDTGSSTVVLRAEDAKRAGIKPVERDFCVLAETANGALTIARVTINTIAVGSIKVKSVAAVVSQNGPGVSLLGQSWLSRLSSLTIAGDRMILLKKR